VFSLDLQTPTGPIPHRGVKTLTLHEAEEEFPRLRTVVLVDAAPPALVELQSQGTVTLRIDTGAGPQVVHDGRVKKLRRKGRELFLETVPASAAFAGVEHTRTFASPDRNPCRIADLPGLRGAFRGVDGLDLLDAVVGQVTQFQENGLNLLRRLARLSDRVVRCTFDAIAVTDPPVGPGSALRPETQVSGTAEWGTELESAVAECLVWNETTGEAPVRPASAPAPAAGLPGVEEARGFYAPAGASDFPAALPVNRTAARAAARAAAERLDRAFYWREALTDLSVRVGSVVTLPSGSPLTGPLRVVRRKVQFGRATDFGVINRVELRPAAGRPRCGHGTEELRLFKAEVSHVADADRLGMIGVRLPWQRPGACVMAAVPQPFGGAFAVPRPGDWVEVLLAPRTVAAPVVLGAVYRGNRPAPTADGADRVEWRTPEGLVIRLSGTARTIELVVLEGETVRARLMIGPDGLRVHGNFRMVGGKMFFE